MEENKIKDLKRELSKNANKCPVCKTILKFFAYNEQNIGY